MGMEHAMRHCDSLSQANNKPVLLLFRSICGHSRLFAA
jgi:hypothetical protein